MAGLCAALSNVSAATESFDVFSVLGQLPNSSTDNEISEIIKKDGEWHKNIYEYFKNKNDKNDKKLITFKKKIEINLL